jgi:30S ribosomal protein S31
MGKGDQRTKKGKRVRKTWGVSRPRTDKGRGALTVAKAATVVAEPPKPKAPKKKAAPKPAPAAKAAPVVEETPVAAPVARFYTR